MGDAVGGVLVVALGFLLAEAVLYLFSEGLRRYQEKRDEKEAKEFLRSLENKITEGLTDPLSKTIVLPRPGEDEVVTTSDQVSDYVSFQGPNPIDPNNPPSYRQYNPKGSEENAPRCSCHQRRVARGDTVLLWPIPNSEGAMDIFCRETWSMS